MSEDALRKEFEQEHPGQLGWVHCVCPQDEHCEYHEQTGDCTMCIDIVEREGLEGGVRPV